MQFSLKPKPCVECGSEPVFHHREYLMLFVNTLVMPFFSSLSDSLSSAFKKSPQSERSSFSIMPKFLDILAALRIGRYLEQYDDKTLLLDQVLWDEAKNRGIVMREFRLFGLPLAAFAAEQNGTRIAFSSFPTAAGAQDAVWWIDTKNILKRKFENLGIPVARGGGAMSWNGAKKIFKKLEAPVIVKPYEGSGSRHTTTHVMDEAGLKRAFDISQQISPMSIVEEELKGAVYRPTVVGGKLAATIRRDVPQVVGDGSHTIKELIEEENKNPKRNGPYYQKIVMTEAHLKELARQGYTMQSVPEAGKTVFLHQKINWSVGGTTTDVTDDVHPDNVALFEKIADVLHAPLVGIDFIIEDISKSWKEQERCGVIECNSRPFFDNHHLPFNGKPRNVAGTIWDFAGF
jgi:cyanophycin synthetase